MEEFFATIFEWFGTNPFYSTDLGDHLRGFDITCTDYIGTHYYVIIGWIIIGITFFNYSLQYHIIDSPRFNRKHHWWLIALTISLLSFLVAFLIPFNAIEASDYCIDLNITTSDIIGFGISVSIWSFLLFLFISSIPWIRSLSTNCRNTTFWKP